jgi:putative CocE/NonD family hydrolase
VSERYPVSRETASFLTRDGIRLDADIYRPDRAASFPILLQRQPYGRAIASTVVYAHPSWYASHGYIVVIQDVRGRGTSTGNFTLFENEIEDGFDTLEWVSRLPNSTGEVGMYGFSYQGMTQLYAASKGHPALKTICPATIAHDLYEDWAYENGAFYGQYNLAWAIQLAAETARLKKDEGAYQKLRLASQNLPLFDPIPAAPRILQELAPDSFYHDWLSRCEPDDYWARLSPKNWMDALDLPMLHIGGWFDPHLRGTLKFYHEMKTRSRHLQRLIIGPWTHLPWGRKAGERDHGAEALSPVDRLQIQWFDYFLKGKESDFPDKPPLYLFEMGSNRWRYLEGFPTENPMVYFLSGQGLAGIREDGGTLSERPGEVASEDTIVHDPWRPVPASGGHSALPGGVFERSSLDCRGDVLTYTSAPLESDLTLLGVPSLEIFCRADAPSHDLCAILSEVHPDGRVFNLSQGYARVDRAGFPLRLPLQATFITLPRHHRLRLSLGASCFPAHPVNPGTGRTLAESRAIDFLHITINVICQGEFSSKITLPRFTPGEAPQSSVIS